PKPETVEQENFDDKDSPKHIRQYEGTVVFYARGSLASPGGLGSLSVDVTGLTCVDAGQCVPYEESLKVDGAGRDGLFQAFPSDLTASAAASTPTGPSRTVAPPGPSSAVKGADASLWLFLLSAVGWGLFTLLMPCTYPMIPITISYFTKQASQREAGT